MCVACKGRGLCPSCGARRRHDVSAQGPKTALARRVRQQPVVDRARRDDRSSLSQDEGAKLGEERAGPAQRRIADRREYVRPRGAEHEGSHQLLGGSEARVLREISCGKLAVPSQAAGPEGERDPDREQHGAAVSTHDSKGTSGSVTIAPAARPSMKYGIRRNAMKSCMRAQLPMPISRVPRSSSTRRNEAFRVR